MRILLDTQAFIWWDDDHTRLSSDALAACRDKSNTFLLSVASVWEMQIKIQIGKLNFSLPLEEKVQDQQHRNGLEILPIAIKHIFTLNSLPDYHRDPFDRLIVAQSIYEKIALVSNDPQIAQYPARVIW